MEDVTSAASYSNDSPVSLSLPALQWYSGQRQRGSASKNTVLGEMHQAL